jgi:hypothetical protein
VLRWLFFSFLTKIIITRLTNRVFVEETKLFITMAIAVYVQVTLWSVNNRGTHPDVTSTFLVYKWIIKLQHSAYRGAVSLEKNQITRVQYTYLHNNNNSINMDERKREISKMRKVSTVENRLPRASTIVPCYSLLQDTYNEVSNTRYGHCINIYTYATPG